MNSIINLLRILHALVLINLFLPMLDAFVNFVQRHVLGWARLQTVNEPSSGLLALPVELLTEVLKSLPWTDVLHIRETCRLLSEATRTRAVWVNLVNEHISSKAVPPRLERPIEVHSARDLEHLFLLWMSAEIGWKKDDGHPARERTFICEPTGRTNLLKGGRWYLATTSTGAVTYYDLDAEIITGTQLIPDQIVKSTRKEDVLVAIEIDPESPFLEFIMAFSLFQRTVGIGITYSAVCVWSVTSLVNDSQQVVGLSATQIASFPHQSMMYAVRNISLLGRHIAFTGVDKEALGVRIYVVDWKRADGESTYPFRIMPGITSGEACVHLLSESSLLLRGAGGVKITNYSVVQEGTGGPQDSSSALLWINTSLEKSDLLLEPVTPFRVAGTTRVILRGERSLHTFSVDDATYRHEPPTIVKLMSLPTGFLLQKPSLGFTRGVMVESGNAMWLLTYAFPAAAKFTSVSSSICKHLISELPRMSETPIMDEETGRVIVSGTSIHPITCVVDFALLRKC